MAFNIRQDLRGSAGFLLHHPENHSGPKQNQMPGFQITLNFFAPDTGCIKTRASEIVMIAHRRSVGFCGIKEALLFSLYFLLQ